MSTLKVNNIEPASGSDIRLQGNVIIVTPTGNEIELGTNNNFSGSVTVTGSLTVDKGDIILKSGSLLIGSGSLNVGYNTLSSSASYWNITSSVSISGSDGGTLDIIGDSTFQGDMIISGCLDIFCYTDDQNPDFWGIDGRTTPNVSGFEVVSINYNTYGDLTAGVAATAASSNNICYIFEPATGNYAPYAYVGTNFDGAATYITASGPDIPTGTIVQVGFSNPIPGATPTYPIGTGSLTPVASFCCDGITLYSDVTISGGLDVYGPTNLHDGLIVTGCIEMYCPGDVDTAWYGYSGNTRFCKSSASVYLNYANLDQSYGDVRTYISQSAAANQGTLQLYNTVTGTTQTVPYVTSSWTGQLTLVEYVTPTLTNFSPVPGPVIHIGNQIPDLYPHGANVLMGTGSSTPTQTATFCCDGNVLYGDSTFTGSVTVTGSTTTSGSVTVTGPVAVTGSILYSGSLDGKGDGKITGSLSVSGSVTVTGSLSVSGSIKSNILTMDTVLDAAPRYSGSKGEMVFVLNSDKYYLYAFLNDSWRSASFA
jgi:hypothetical protein